jgi:hypothetical protein
MDDNITTQLNSSMSTRPSTNDNTRMEACEAFVQSLQHVWQSRMTLIKTCIEKQALKVAELENQKLKKLEQRNLDSMQSELQVEAIIASRVKDVLKQRCRGVKLDSLDVE